MMSTPIEHGVQEWMDYAQGVVNANSLNYYTLSFNEGKKYLRVVMSDNHGHGSAYAFIDRETGDVFKPASWKSPAKHARCNVTDPASWKAAVGPYGIAHLR